MKKWWFAIVLSWILMTSGCGLFPEVWWEEENCSVTSSTYKSGSWEPEFQGCEAEMASQGIGGYDMFLVTLRENASTVELLLTMSTGSKTNGEHKIVGGLSEFYEAKDDGSAEPGKFYGSSGDSILSGTIEVADFSFEAGPSELSGPLGLNRFNSRYGTFDVTFHMKDVKAGDVEVTGSITAKGEKLRELNPLGSPDNPGGSDCLVGTWDAPPGCTNGDFNTIYFFKSTGKAENADCAGICAKNTNYQDFKWTRNEGQNQLTLEYGYGETCGEPNPYNTTVTADYSCTNNALELNDVTWTRR